jgi:antitoxin component YwqK of YwqJK toxin-antitoxin module
METINQKDENGNRTGLWKWYYDNGELWYEGSFFNGNRDGLWKHYRKNGKLYHEVVYVNAIGFGKDYNETGELIGMFYYA